MKYKKEQKVLVQGTVKEVLDDGKYLVMIGKENLFDGFDVLNLPKVVEAEELRPEEEMEKEKEKNPVEKTLPVPWDDATEKECVSVFQRLLQAERDGCLDTIFSCRTLEPILAYHSVSEIKKSLDDWENRVPKKGCILMVEDEEADEKVKAVVVDVDEMNGKVYVFTETGKMKTIPFGTAFERTGETANLDGLFRILF